MGHSAPHLLLMQAGYEKKKLYSNKDIFISDISDVEDKFWDSSQDLYMSVCKTLKYLPVVVCETPQSVKNTVKQKDFQKVKFSDKAYKFNSPVMR